MEEQFEAIAEGLANQGYAIVDQFLSQSEVEAILISPEYQSDQDRFRRAHIGRNESMQINESIRTDHIRWIDRNEASSAVHVYLDRLDQLIQYLNRSLFLSLKDYEVHLTIYPAGSFYKRHLDQFRRDDHRKLSVICYLNDNWSADQGGQLRMYLPEGEQDVLPLAGRLVCFRSDQIEHEVLPATRTRLSITGWMLDRPLGV